MSAFALPISPGCLTAVPSSIYGTLRYRGRRTEDGRRNTDNLTNEPPTVLQLFRDYLIFVSPISPGALVDVTQVERVARPNPHLIRRSDRHPRKRLNSAFDRFWRPITFRNIGADGLARPAHLIAQRLLFDLRHLQAFAMNLKRDAIRSPKDLEVLERNTLSLSCRAHLSSVICLLSSATQSFGSWLEPRYIFGAETLV